MDNKIDGKHQYCSQAQKDELVRLVTEDNDLLLGKLTNNYTFKDSRKKWDIIASQLNAIPGGHKDWKQWRKTWQDIKSRTKSKKAALTRYSKGTGGGPPHIGNITSVEEKVLSVINPTLIRGNNFVNESNIEFVLEDDNFESSYAELSIDEKIDELCDEVKPTEYTEPLPKITGEESKMQTENGKENATPKRLVAANRLQMSAQATANLADLSKQRLDFEKELAVKKFEYEREYREKKLIVLERQARVFEDLVLAIKNNAAMK